MHGGCEPERCAIAHTTGKRTVAPHVPSAGARRAARPHGSHGLPQLHRSQRRLQPRGPIANLCRPAHRSPSREPLHCPCAAGVPRTVFERRPAAPRKTIPMTERPCGTPISIPLGARASSSSSTAMCCAGCSRPASCRPAGQARCSPRPTTRSTRSTCRSSSCCRGCTCRNRCGARAMSSCSRSCARSSTPISYGRCCKARCRSRCRHAARITHSRRTICSRSAGGRSGNSGSCTRCSSAC